MLGQDDDAHEKYVEAVNEVARLKELFAKTGDTFQATNPPLGRKFTQDDVDSCWAYAQDYFLQILNGEYDVRQARDDLTGLIGSKYDSRGA